MRFPMPTKRLPLSLDQNVGIKLKVTNSMPCLYFIFNELFTEVFFIFEDYKKDMKFLSRILKSTFVTHSFFMYIMRDILS